MGHVKPNISIRNHAMNKKARVSNIVVVESRLSRAASSRSNNNDILPIGAIRGKDTAPCLHAPPQFGGNRTSSGDGFIN